ncbi:MAG: TAXI family TRAP transporter solute-binding subunit [Halorhabdus sp.]
MSDSKTSSVDRRTFVKLGSAGVIGGLAGCSGGGGGNQNGGGEDSGGDQDGGGGEQNTGTKTTASSGGNVPSSLTFAGGGEGGAWYLGAATWAQFAKKAFSGVNTTTTTGGGRSNVVKTSNKELDFAWTFTNTLNQGYHGTAGFPKSYKNIRAVCSVWPAQVMALAHPDIKSYNDLKGKSIAPGKKGFSGYAAALRVLKNYGISKDQVEIVTGGYSAMPSLFKDGTVASVHVMGSIPHPVISNSLAQAKGRLLPVNSDIRSKIISNNPGYLNLDIPAGSFDAVNNDSAVSTVGAQTIVFTYKDMPESVVYELTKMNFKNKQRMVDAHSVYQKMSVDQATAGFSDVPIHPGAKRALKELGADV